MGKEKIIKCTIPIPDNVALQIKNQWPDIPRRALEAFALQAYRNGVITEYEVQKLLKRLFTIYVSTVWEVRAEVLDIHKSC